MRRLTLLLPLIVIASGVFSQTVEFTAATDKVAGNKGEKFMITFSLNSFAQSANFIPPDFGKLKVLTGPSVTFSMNIINGKQTSSSTFVYMVFAEEAGEYTITPAGYILNGNTLNSNPLKITISDSLAKEALVADEFARLAEQNRKSDTLPSKVEFIATTSRTKCSRKQLIEIEYSLNLVTHKGTFIPPDFRRFSVKSGPTHSTSQSLINGVFSSTSEYRYRISAAEAGEYAIPPAGYVLNGDTFYSNALSIMVMDSVAESNSIGLLPDDLMLRLEPNKLKGDLNDTFFVHWNLYSETGHVSSLTFGNKSIPDYFIVENDTQTGEWIDTVLNGSLYKMIALRKSAWHPLKTGKIEVPPLEISLVARVRTEGSGFFAQYEDINVNLESDAFTLEVSPVTALTHPYGRRAEIIEALAKPKASKPNPESSGNNIVFLTDVSSSMLIKDFESGRIPAIKSAMMDFVNQSKYDRIGLMTFSDTAAADCKPGTDYKKLTTAISQFTQDTSTSVPTAIGNALLEATDILKTYEGKRVIVLITDGVSNTFISPRTATDIACKFNIVIYTIGIGGEGKAPYPMKFQERTFDQDVEITLDEESLQNIAALSGGKYFRARNEKELKQAVMEIRKLL